MIYWKTLVAFAVSAFAAHTAGAAPTPAEAARLGKDLTPIGAEKAGNKEGTIPAWTGGLCSPPPGYKPANGKSGFPYVDPFAAEKPMASITAANVAQWADKLDPGAIELFKRFPATYRMDVYPTHRSVCLPDWVYENTIKRVMNPKLVSDAPGLEGAHAQFPFPIPKTGHELMWNTITGYHPVYWGGDWQTWLVDAGGNKTLVAKASTAYHWEFWDNTKTKSDKIQGLLNTNTSPASKAGSMDMRINWARMDEKPPRAWSYTPGQRRVRLAPEFTYDTVAAQYGGMIVFDEISGFDGKMDRFDFKIVGKKEMLVPYNQYRHHNISATTGSVDSVMLKDHVNPDMMRWELHRVWIVEATRKAGARHIYSKKVWQIDEDSWRMLGYQAYDEAGKLYRVQNYPLYHAYDIKTPVVSNQVGYDFVKNGWFLGSSAVGQGWRAIDPLPDNYLTPDSMAAKGVR
jgi:hypothetical protein